MTMNFNQSGTLLSVGSENGTLHVFKVEKKEETWTSKALNIVYKDEYATIRNISIPYISGYIGKDVVVIGYSGAFQKWKTSEVECSLLEERNWFKIK